MYQPRQQKILILEDSKHRIDKFRSLFINHQVTVFGSASAAIDSIITKYDDNGDVYDAVYLDHDLDDMQYVDWNTYPNTGMAFVDKLIESGIYHYKTFPIIVHSHNAGAAFEMRNRLLKAGYIAYQVPFWQINGDTFKAENLRGLNEEQMHILQILDNLKFSYVDLIKAVKNLKGLNEDSS